MTKIPWLLELKAWIAWGRLYQWWLLAGYVGLMLGIVVIRSWWLRPRASQSVHGTGGWATRWQLWRAGCFNRQGFVMGIAYGCYIRSPFEQNLVGFMPPGEGKTSGPVTASLIARDQASAIVLALDDDIIRLTAPFRRTIGSVYIWEPASPISDMIDPYGLVDWGTDHEVEQLQRLTSHTVSSLGLTTSSGASHYERVADDGLATTSLYVAHQHTPPRCTFPMMLDFYSASDRKPRAILVEMSHHPHPSVRRGVARLLKKTDAKLQDDWSAATEWLTRWEDPKLARATSATTIPWRALQTSERPMTIYLRLSSDDARGRLHRLLRMTVDLWVFQLAQIKRAHPGLVRDLDWYFDDVGVLGDFPPLDDIVVEHRKDQFRLMAMFQAPEQAWHESGHRSGLLNSCGCWVISRQNSPDSAKFLEAKLAETTVVEPTDRVTTGTTWSRSRGVQSYKRPLMTFGEIQSMRPNDVVLCIRHLKVRGRRVNVYRDRVFQRLLRRVS